MLRLEWLRRLWVCLHGSLRARLFIPTAALSIATLGGMVLAAVHFQTADIEQGMYQRAMAFSNLAARALEAHIVEDRGSGLTSLLKAVKEHREEIDSVSLVNPLGEVRHSSSPALLGAAPFPVEGLDWSRPLDQGDHYTVLQPLVNEARCTGCHGPETKVNGWLAIRFSAEPIHAARRRLTSGLLLAALPSLALLLGVSLWLLRREAIRPIQRLVAAMERAAGGEVEVRADEGRPDEIGMAARRFDATLAALRRSQEELARTYELRLIRADRFAMVGQMATGLAHEIKNPLAGLSGALEVLAEDVRGTPRGEVVAEMRHQVDRLAHTMESLLSFARPPRAQLRHTDVNAALEKVLFLISQQRQGALVEVRRELDRGLPPVRADAAQLEQVFLNICLNAYQALNGQRGALSVRSRAVEHEVHIEVSDTGPGIPPEVQRHLFTPFFTTRANGTGLGLAISARLVAEHGGSIHFRCPPEGGTTFTVSLPVCGVGLSGVAPVGSVAPPPPEVSA
jgi:signal transduction histidine kinase